MTPRDYKRVISNCVGSGLSHLLSAKGVALSLKLPKRDFSTWKSVVISLLPLGFVAPLVLAACAHNPASPGPPSPPTGSPSPSCNIPLWVGWIEWKYELSYHDTVGNSKHDQDYQHTVRWELNGVENMPCNANIAQSSYTGHTYLDEYTPVGASCKNEVYDHFKSDWDVVNPVEDQLSMTEDPNGNVLVSTRSVNHQRPIGSFVINQTFRECGQAAGQMSDRKLLLQAELDLVLPPVPSRGHLDGKTDKKKDGSELGSPLDQQPTFPFPFSTINAQISWSLDLLPDECRHSHVSESDKPKLDSILKKSPSYVSAVNTIGADPEFEMKPAPPAVGKHDKGATIQYKGKALSVVYSDRADSVFGAASTKAHEISHYVDLLNRNGLTFKDLAPFLTVEEYTALRWAAEARAYDFQAKVLDELAAGDRSQRACVQHLRVLDPGASTLSPQDRRKDVMDRNSRSGYVQRWTEESKGAGSSAAKAYVTGLRVSGDIQQARQQFGI